MKFKDKFVGFVDILGWKKMVEAAESGTEISLNKLLEVLRELGTFEDRIKYEKNGPMVCPESKFIERDLDFQLTQISDCLIVSVEVSPAGLINLINHCWGVVIRLLAKGIMCRGYITRGQVYHTENQIIGSGYQNAIRKEEQVTAFRRTADERGTPFVEIDSSVCDYVRDHGDSCVKEMFSRYVKEDGTVAALFPFKRLQHSFIIGRRFGLKFDPEKERQSNQNMRSMIEKMKKHIMAFVDQSNTDAVRKAEHYIAALNTQLEICKKTDEMIDTLNPSFS